ncbi:hypothetical protein L6R52_36535 [Myxococcota bacterium]|nr:hypothetical protein [Myxococcota bacterium]
MGLSRRIVHAALGLLVAYVPLGGLIALLLVYPFLRKHDATDVFLLVFNAALFLFLLPVAGRLVHSPVLSRLVMSRAAWGAVVGELAGFLSVNLFLPWFRGGEQELMSVVARMAWRSTLYSFAFPTFFMTWAIGGVAGVAIAVMQHREWMRQSR